MKILPFVHDLDQLPDYELGGLLLGHYKKGRAEIDPAFINEMRDE